MIKNYVISNLASELREIRTSFRSEELSMLTEYEKAVIYKYTDDGYGSVNERLRASKGIDLDEFGKYLIQSLKKLPNYPLLCFRAAHLSQSEIKRYTHAFDNSTPITEYAFTSSSQSRLIAIMYSPYNVLFRIKSKTGKSIENIAKFGINSGQNEKEILFIPNTNFLVLDIITEGGKLIITLEEN